MSTNPRYGTDDGPGRAAYRTIPAPRSRYTSAGPLSTQQGLRARARVIAYVLAALAIGFTLVQAAAWMALPPFSGMAAPVVDAAALLCGVGILEALRRTAWGRSAGSDLESLLGLVPRQHSQPRR